jgi:putative ABC transport system permease protein
METEKCAGGGYYRHPLGWTIWASLLAWAAAAALMSRWLESFAYHVTLDPVLFVAAAVGALVLALATLAAHCYSIARANPILALRYE